MIGLWFMYLRHNGRDHRIIRYRGLTECLPILARRPFAQKSNLIMSEYNFMKITAINSVGFCLLNFALSHAYEPF